MKALIETKDYKEVDINFPFFAYIQEENKEIFVRIDENQFRQITKYENGMIEIFKCRYSGYLAFV